MGFMPLQQWTMTMGIVVDRFDRLARETEVYLDSLLNKRVVKSINQNYKHIYSTDVNFAKADQKVSALLV